MLSHLSTHNDDSNQVDLLYHLCKENQIEQVLNLLPFIGHINIINQIQKSTGSTCLHVACYYGHQDMVRILLDYGAQHSIRNIRHNLTPYEETTSNEIKQLLIEQQEKFFSKDDYDYIQWSMIGEDLLEKRREFRQAIDLYKNYDNQHLVSKLLVEVIHYYLNEYLINQNQLIDNEKTENLLKEIEDYFKEAIDKQDYLTYFIKAYTSTYFFYKVLNRDLALYVLEYFDQTKTFSSNYRLVNCLVHIVSLLMYHPNLRQYQFQGLCYRGMRITINDLNQYQINQHILNRSFLSASIDRCVAEMFAGIGQQSQMRYTSSQEDSSPIQYSCLCQYLIKQNLTAIDIQSLSIRPDEQEILIIPFSVFKVMNIKKNYLEDPNATISIEIELEECEEINPNVDLQHFESRNDQLSAVDDHIRDTEEYIRFKKRKSFRYRIYGLLISIIVLIISVTFVFAFAFKISIPINKNTTNFSSNLDTSYDYQLPLGCPNVFNRSDWNARPYITRDKLVKFPVTHIVVKQLSSWRFGMNEQEDCIKAMKDLQNFQMNKRGWFDIGYNFLICNDNHDQQQIYIGRGWRYIGAHCLGYNEKSLGIGVLGDYTSQQSLITFKSFLQCGIAKNAIVNNFTLVKDLNSTDIYEYYLNSFKNDTDLSLSNRDNDVHYSCD